MKGIYDVDKKYTIIKVSQFNYFIGKSHKTFAINVEIIGTHNFFYEILNWMIDLKKYSKLSGKICTSNFFLLSIWIWLTSQIDF